MVIVSVAMFLGYTISLFPLYLLGILISGQRTVSK